MTFLKFRKGYPVSLAAFEVLKISCSDASAPFGRIVMECSQIGTFIIDLAKSYKNVYCVSNA